MTVLAGSRELQWARRTCPATPLSAILDATLSDNGGPTRSLVFGSPAVDTISGVACATGTDQRGAPRPQDADGFADCDSGAVERGLMPIQAEITNTTLDCNSTAGSPLDATCWRPSASTQ
jgi:hypothetical protein